MVTTQLIGALLILGGIIYMATAAIYRGRMSDPHPNAGADAKETLEPRHRGLGFLGVAANWPGLLLVVGGALLMLLDVFQAS